MHWARHVARMREKKKVCRIFVGKTERKKPLGRARHGWVNNSKMYLRAVG
jgi:hypothetical protein